MPQQVSIPVADLLLDESNARIKGDTASQQEAAVALARQQGKRLLVLAQNVIDHGLDPAQLVSVIATGDTRRRYVVLEGNRRTLAVKALETPTLIQQALSNAEFKRLQSLSAKFAQSPISEMHCILYDTSERQLAYQRVANRHSGAQDGAGLVEWDSNEKDRFSARHGSAKLRSLGGQLVDFIEHIDGPLAQDHKITTTLTRLLSTPEVREALGLERIDGQLYSRYSRDAAAGAIRRVVNDLVNEVIKVADVYTANDRRKYAKSLGALIAPSESKLEKAARLDELQTGQAPTSKPKPARPKPRKAKARAERTTVASPSATLNPSTPRVNAIYYELLSLSASQFPNAGSVLLRVFLELSVDHYLAAHSLCTEKERNDWKLAKRLKTVGSHLLTNGSITAQMEKVVTKVADSQHTFAAGVVTFNQYVHNQYAHPKEGELRASWDELQPIFEAIWK